MKQMKQNELSNTILFFLGLFLFYSIIRDWDNFILGILGF